MYTQCPECETYFRVTEDDLGAAEGQVRCSQCDSVFDARTRLLTPAQEHALAAPAVGADPAPESADDPAIGDLFGAGNGGEDEGAHGRAHDVTAGDAHGTAPEPAVDADEFGTRDAPRLDPRLDDALPLDAGAHGLPEPVMDDSLPRTPLGFELPTGASPLLTDAGRPRPKRGPWLAASVVLTLALGAQFVHANREPLARDPRVGPVLVDAYRSLRLPLKAPTDLARLSVARADVTSHPVYRDVLYITATVTNDAEFTQPLPLLRVRLDDRWGEPVGVRIFRPEEYLRRAEPSTRAEPGRAYAIALEVVDPGSEAVGYALTPCLPQGSSLICLGDG